MTPASPGDIRCVTCGADCHLESAQAAAAYRCAGCGRVFTSVWGVPFFGDYEKEDVPGLIEIAANIINRRRFGVTPSVVEDWERLLRQYDSAPDKADFIKTVPAAQSPFLANRYGEWCEIRRLCLDLDLHGRKVLDVGAGLGFDSHRLAMRGAKVTALEFSPVLAESGQENFPHIRWIGGFSHCLPFHNSSFDAVFCNAALHHMRDIPAAIREALRVLRPGGILITTCDSFRPSDAGDDVELQIFDGDTAVLQGVNEGIPRFSDFVGVLQAHSDLLDVEVYTHTLYDAPGGGTLTELTRWNLQRNGAMLAQRSGSLALRVRLGGSWPGIAPVQTAGVLPADRYASWMESASTAVARLATLMPDRYVDLPFPGTKSLKFELLNGWRAPRPFHHARTAYQRGRWFLRRPLADRLGFEISRPAGGGCQVESVDVVVNGATRACVPLTDGWAPADIDISDIEVGAIFAVELLQRGAGPGLAQASFKVRNRRLAKAGAALTASANTCDASVTRPTVYAVIPVFNRLAFTRTCIEQLRLQSYGPLKIIVADGGSTDGTPDAIRREFPDVAVLTAESELWWTGSMALGVTHALHLSQGRPDYLLMMNNDTLVGEDFVAILLRAAMTHDAAVGALVVDSAHPERALDAGEYIDWNSYAFPVKGTVGPDETFCDDVDVLPGRGTLVPMKMIRAAGNVDAKSFPHYLADYEFFYRLKRHGFRLGVCYETRVLAHIGETGIVPSAGTAGFRAIWREAFSRRSMNNIVDHWRFASRHAPASRRGRVLRRLARRMLVDFTLRTPLRPAFLPFYWLAVLPGRIVAVFRGQIRAFTAFARSVHEHGADVLCDPRKFPGLIRWPLYLAASPGPLRIDDLESLGLPVQDLLQRGALRPLKVDGWVALRTLDFSEMPESAAMRRLFWGAWNPARKWSNTMAWRRDLRKRQAAA